VARIRAACRLFRRIADCLAAQRCRRSHQLQELSPVAVPVGAACTAGDLVDSVETGLVAVRRVA
jgi:hypothetical protein